MCSCVWRCTEWDRGIIPDEDSRHKECEHEAQTGEDHGSDWLGIPPAQILHWDWVTTWWAGTATSIKSRCTLTEFFALSGLALAHFIVVAECNKGEHKAWGKCDSSYVVVLQQVLFFILQPTSNSPFSFFESLWVTPPAKSHLSISNGYLYRYLLPSISPSLNSSSLHALCLQFCCTSWF